MRALLFIVGAQLAAVCVVCAAVLLYNDRAGWWWFALMSTGFMPALYIRS